MVVCKKCGGPLRKLEYTVSKNNPNVLHKKTICNDCGAINEWDKFYPEPKLMNMRYWKPTVTKGSFDIKFGTPESKGKPTPKYARFVDGI